MNQVVFSRNSIKKKSPPKSLNFRKSVNASDKPKYSMLTVDKPKLFHLHLPSKQPPWLPCKALLNKKPYINPETHPSKSNHPTIWFPKRCVKPVPNNKITTIGNWILQSAKTNLNNISPPNRKIRKRRRRDCFKTSITNE